MQEKTSLVITSIAAPNKALKAYAEGCARPNYDFVMIGDVPSPADFHLDGCDFYSLARQRELPFKFSKNVPERHYSRKNIGYLLAIKNGAKVILETDDDNLPREEFWGERTMKYKAPRIEEKGWVNAYKYFSDRNIWPRGFALEDLGAELPSLDNATVESWNCPIQQGLADVAPDVDAIYRLINPNETDFTFEKKAEVVLGKNTWCPFNSQNTTWFPEAFPLLYLPSYCSFRMTDIWRSFIAQRILWTLDMNLLFHSSTVWQERNEHNILKDFEDEISGYLNNGQMCKVLGALDLAQGKENIFQNMVTCYKAMVENKWVDEKELLLLNDWIEDLKTLGF
jgi:hypothetical protein